MNELCVIWTPGLGSFLVDLFFRNFTRSILSLASLVAQMVKNLPAMWETWVQPLGWEDPLEKGTASGSILAWRIPWTEETGGVQSRGSQRVRHDWATKQQWHSWFGLVLVSSSFYNNISEVSYKVQNLSLTDLEAAYLSSAWSGEGPLPGGKLVTEPLSVRRGYGALWDLFLWRTNPVLDGSNLMTQALSRGPTPSPSPLRGSVQFSSVAQSCPTLCDPMNRSTPGLPVHHQLRSFYPNSCPLSPWCHPTISSSIAPFSSHLQSFPASGSFQMSQFFASGGQRIFVSASTSVLPMNTQDWSPLGWAGCTSLLSKGLSRIFSNTTVQKHQFFSAQLSL